VTCGSSVVFSTNKIDSHDITEILSKVALNTIILTLYRRNIYVPVSAAGVGLYGNEKTNNGVENFDMAVRDINSTLNEALGTVCNLCTNK
jgi:hypothetical protein